MKYQLRSFREAAHRNAFEDGVAEVLLGVLLATAAAVVLRRTGILILAVAAVLPWALQRLRNRITRPRVGEAELPREAFGSPKGILVYAILAAGVTLVAFLLAVSFGGARFGGYRWVPLFAGLAVSGGFLAVASRTRLKRFYLYFAAAIGGGVFCALTASSGARQDGYEALRNLLWGLSALLLVVGTATLIGFIRRNPVFSGEAEGRGPNEQ